LLAKPPIVQQRFDLHVRAGVFRHGLEFMVPYICNPGPGDFVVPLHSVSIERTADDHCGVECQSRRLQ
jgi:hypothetical protein